MLMFLTFSMLSHVLFIHCFLSEVLSALMFSNVSFLEARICLPKLSKGCSAVQCPTNRRHLIKACKTINSEAMAI